jgi:transcriptional regulator with XRE-family HTH domain
MVVSVTTVKLSDLPRELRRLRREAEISQQTVGDRMGWYSRNLVRWENGKSPKLCVAQQWAKALGFDVRVTLVPTDE